MCGNAKRGRARLGLAGCGMTVFAWFAPAQGRRFGGRQRRCVRRRRVHWDRRCRERGHASPERAGPPPCVAWFVVMSIGSLFPWTTLFPCTMTTSPVIVVVLDPARRRRDRLGRSGWADEEDIAFSHDPLGPCPSRVRAPGSRWPARSWRRRPSASREIDVQHVRTHAVLALQGLGVAAPDRQMLGVDQLQLVGGDVDGPRPDANWAAAGAAVSMAAASAVPPSGVS